MSDFVLIDGSVVSALSSDRSAFGRRSNEAIEVKKGSVDVDYIRQPDGSFKAPTKPEQVPEPLKPVTRKQLIDVLIDHDLDEQVEPALDAISDDKTRKKALNAWRNASHYEPDHPLFLHLREALKLSDAEFDTFWHEAMEV